MIGVTGGKIGFYGVAPVTQPTANGQSAVTPGTADGKIEESAAPHWRRHRPPAYTALIIVPVNLHLLSLNGAWVTA